MENVIVFVFSIAIILSILAIIMSGSLTSFYSVSEAEKEVIHRLAMWSGSVETNYYPMSEKLMKIDVNGSEVNITNIGYRDLFYVRLLCWDRYDPFSGSGPQLLNASVNGSIVGASVSVLSSGEVAEYNLALLFDDAKVRDGNIACAVITGGFIRSFVPAYISR